MFHLCWKILCNDEVFQVQGKLSSLFNSQSSKGVSLRTYKGNEWFYVFLGPYSGDLQELYMVARQYCTNFGEIARGCIICNVPGQLLGEIETNGLPTLQSHSDTIITATVEAIINGDKEKSKDLLSDLKASCSGIALLDDFLTFTEWICRARPLL